MENQPIVRLTFMCNRNWEDMKIVAGGRFCNDCQKKVVDFTDKTNEEIAAYLMGSTTIVCGNFRQSQLAPALPKPIWKRWLSAAAMFVAVFIGVKEASAQTKVISNTTSKISQDKNNNFAIGEVTVKSFIPANALKKQSPPLQQTIIFDPVEPTASFPGGDNALQAFLAKKVRYIKGTKDGRVIVQFMVNTSGKLSDFKIMRSLTSAADAEVIRALKTSPDWTPVKQSGKPIASLYTIPFIFKN